MASNKLVIGPAYTRTLIDDFVKLRARICKLNALEDQMREVLIRELAKKNRKALIGNKFVVTKTEEERTSLNKAKVEAILTPAQFKRCLVTTPFTKLTSRNLE